MEAKFLIHIEKLKNLLRLISNKFHQNGKKKEILISSWGLGTDKENSFLLYIYEKLQSDHILTCKTNKCQNSHI